MATQRLTMRKIREILRQKLALGRSHREVATSVGVSIGAISKIVGDAHERGLTLEAIDGMSDEALERVFYGSVEAARTARPLPDFPTLHTERRRPGVTLALLHEEHLKAHPDGYRYTQFCELYRTWVKRRGLTMRIDHLAGDKCFVDYSGDRLHIVDAQTGECRPVELFVAALGASNYTFADVTMTQRGADFIASHVRMLEFFGGVPAALVPDQLKSGVTRSCWYDPQIHGAGLPLVPRDPASRQGLRRRSTRGRVRPRRRRPGPHLQERQVDPRGQPRSSTAARRPR